MEVAEEGTTSPATRRRHREVNGTCLDGATFKRPLLEPCLSLQVRVLGSVTPGLRVPEARTQDGPATAKEWLQAVPRLLCNDIPGLWRPGDT